MRLDKPLTSICYELTKKSRNLKARVLVMGQQGVCVGLVLFWGCREGWMLKEVGAG